jgi:hypothetical protein
MTSPPSQRLVPLYLLAAADMTERVLRLMGLGQFIPPQLAILPQILHILDPSQVGA